MSDYPTSAPGAASAVSPGAAPRRPFRRLPFMLLLLLGVVVLAYIPALEERIAYVRTRGQLRALHDVLPDMNLKALSKAFTLVYRKVEPSVVHITAYRTLQVRTEKNPPRAVNERLQASGVIVDPAGYIITNQHVVEGTNKLEVSLYDGRSFTATVVGGDPGVDIAVLKIDANSLTAAELADSDKLDVGELVWAIGNPYGLDQTVTAGIVSAKGRHGAGPDIFKEFLQTDAPVNPGNSGGPLVDVNGDVVGITTAIIGQGISFAIPSNLVRETYKQIRSNGKVVRGFLGMILEADPLTPEVAARLKLPAGHPPGALVWQLVPNGPAQKAGILPLDFIVEYNGQAITDSNQLLLMIAHTPVGTKVPIKVLREGNPQTIEATIEERPTDAR